MHTHAYIHMHSYTCIHTHAYIHTYIHTYTHMHTHTHTHTHIHHTKVRSPEHLRSAQESTDQGLVLLQNPVRAGSSSTASDTVRIHAHASLTSIKTVDDECLVFDWSRFEGDQPITYSKRRYMIQSEDLICSYIMYIRFHSKRGAGSF